MPASTQSSVDRWTIIRRRDWPQDHGSLVQRGHAPEPDDDLEVIEVVPVAEVECLRAELERLRKVEQAARTYFKEFDHLIGNRARHDYPERRALRDALEGEGSADVDAAAVRMMRDMGVSASETAEWVSDALRRRRNAR